MQLVVGMFKVGAHTTQYCGPGYEFCPPGAPAAGGTFFTLTAPPDPNFTHAPNRASARGSLVRALAVLQYFRSIKEI